MQPDTLLPDTFVSVVGIIENDGDILEKFVREVHVELSDAYSDHEIVLIDNASEDDSALRVEKMLKQIPSIRFIRLTSAVSEDIVFAAGLENAIGDIVILMLPGVDPPGIIHDLVKQCHDGDDIIVGVADNLPQTVFYRLFRSFGHGIIRRVLHYNSPKNSTTLRCLSRRAVNAVTQTSFFHQRFSVRIYRTGFQVSTYSYRLEGRSSRTRKRFLEGLEKGMQMLVFNSTYPLRFVNMIGLFGSAFAVLIGLYSIILKLCTNLAIEGWASQVTINAALFFLVFVILTFFGEYLRRLLEDQGTQQRYTVLFEKNSFIMVNPDRLNVLNESVDPNPSKVQTSRNS